MEEKKIILEFLVDDANLLLRGLDELPHKQVRRIIDYIWTESQKQIKENQNPIPESNIK